MGNSKIAGNKKVAFVCVIVLVLCIVAALIFGPDNGFGNRKNNEAIKIATVALKETWIKVYNDISSAAEGDVFTPENLDDRKIEIKGVRLIKVNENNIESYKDVEYIVEYVLYSNRYRTSPYYVREDIYDTVLVYKDGRAEVAFNNILKSYADMFELESVSKLVGEITYYDDEYDKIIDLNGK